MIAVVSPIIVDTVESPRAKYKEIDVNVAPVAKYLEKKKFHFVHITTVNLILLVN